MKMKRENLVNFTSLFILYFIQAMPYGFQSRYLPLVMRKQGTSITSLGLFKLLLIPWICKFFIAAFLVDVYKTKRFWLLLSLIVLSLGSFLGMTCDSHDFATLALILFLLNWASATQDICVDWFAMNTLEKEDLGIGNTIQVGGFKLGTLFSGGFLVFLMDYTTVSQTFALLGVIYLISLFLMNISFYKTETSDKKSPPEKASTGTDGSGQQLALKERIRLLHNSPGTYWICLFVLIYKLGNCSCALIFFSKMPINQF
jgi:predicted MFS family arabinose efflux permease